MMATDSRTPLTLDDLNLTQFGLQAAGFGTEQFGYVVTPNVDHLIRLSESAPFRSSYADARFVLLDSRILAQLLRLRFGLKVAVSPGSDAVAGLFDGVIRTTDRIVLVGGTNEQIEHLVLKYGLQDLCHVSPPMGFIRDPQAVEACLEAIEAHSPFRFCLLAVGSPQQEYVAQALARRGKAHGLALCVGASVDFLTGRERRAPVWMQRLHAEWLYRLLQSPRRMAYRYLVRGPRIFTLIGRFAVTVRRPGSPAA
jgi:exopolysaccharide biosynthesis WecB/TagA/CpsF family protein